MPAKQSEAFQLEIGALTFLVADATQYGPEGLSVALEAVDSTSIESKDFEDTRLSAVFAAIAKAVRANQAPDQFVLSKTCDKNIVGKIFCDAISAPPMAAKQRLALVRDNACRRRYVDALRSIAMLAKSRATELPEIIAEANRTMRAWSESNDKQSTLEPDLARILGEMDDAHQRKSTRVVPTGIAALDDVIGGHQPTLTVIGALPSVGKSSLAAGFCRLLAMRGLDVGMISLEDERGWLTRRLLSFESDVPLFVVANRPPTVRQLENAQVAAGGIAKYLRKIHIDDRSGMTTDEVVASARSMIARGVKAIFIDHLGEIRLKRSDRHDLDISETLSDLRSLAKVHQIPVVVFCHLRRREGLSLDSEPKMSDFAFSAGVERMSRVALGLWKSDDENKINCTVLKQTQGIRDVTLALNLDKRAAIVVETESSNGTATLYD